MPVMNVPVGMPDVMPVTIDGRRGFRIGGRTNAEQAAYTAEHAADRTTYNRTNWACGLGADGKPMRNPIGNALGLRRKRTCERGSYDSRQHDMVLHAATPPCVEIRPPAYQ
jgi:hypothetical protein